MSAEGTVPCPQCGASGEGRAEKGVGTEDICIVCSNRYTVTEKERQAYVRAQAAEISRTDPKFNEYCRLSHEAKLTYLFAEAGRDPTPRTQAARCMFHRADRMAWHNECCFLIQHAVRMLAYHPHESIQKPGPMRWP